MSPQEKATAGRDELYAEARRLISEVMETETAFTFDNNDNDPTTVADFVADMISGLERLQARLESAEVAK